ncbi:hypothetical protein SAY87_013007 [Trapa incisa]|uniref:Uncharacterized protein n=1 Tax=Trapa incisa TaxID=236973 RepID=A0AAN7KAW2_9MYRT|nr:hypothetical protein SAY87_013007 [Trapa incisa]
MKIQERSQIPQKCNYSTLDLPFCSVPTCLESLDKANFLNLMQCRRLMLCVSLSYILIVSGFTCKLIIISNNCPPLKKSEIEYYFILAKVVSIITMETMLIWALLVENTLGSAASLSPTQAIETSSKACPVNTQPHL